MSKFKVGDRVRLTGKRWPSTGLLIGDIVTITGDEAYEGAFQADGDEWYIYENYEAELVEDAPPTVDPVSPAHYQFPGGAEVINITRHLGFLEGNVIKYVARAGRKDDKLSDLLKARKYLDWAIESADGPIESVEES